MRIRSIRPEFWTSEDIKALAWDSRLIFIGLWSYVDDNGVGRDVEKLITGALFPLEDDPRDTLAKVSRALATLSERGMVSRYTVEDKPYLHITSWATHQRIDKAAKSRYPLPTCENADPRDTLATPSRDLREGSPIGEGEKGRRGEGEKRLSLAPEVDLPDEDDDEVIQPKRREIRLPASWAPTAAHIKFAAERNVSIEDAVEGFRNHATTHDRHAASWNGAFHSWLVKAAPKATPRTGSSIWDRKPPVRSAS